MNVHANGTEVCPLRAKAISFPGVFTRLATPGRTELGLALPTAVDLALLGCWCRGRLAKTGDFANACDFQNRVTFFSERIDGCPFKNIIFRAMQNVFLKGNLEIRFE